jgi:hypothetical protein
MTNTQIGLAGATNRPIAVGNGGRGVGGRSVPCGGHDA